MGLGGSLLRRRSGRRRHRGSSISSSALDRQLTQIERNLSYYFSPNTHLLGEALALYVCGRTLPWLAAAARYERIGRTVLLNEISRQIAGDGGHRERSAHYHRYTLDFYLLARRDRPHHRRSGGGAVRRRSRSPGFRRPPAGRRPRPAAPHRRRRRRIDVAAGRPRRGRHSRQPRGCRRAHRAARSPDRSDAGGSLLAARPSALWPGDDRSSRAPEPIASAALAESGYFVSRSADGDHLVVDAGPHGYRNAGHAHADALALTFTVRGVPFLIDSGTGLYTDRPECPGSNAIERAPQHADARRPLAVDAARALPLAHDRDRRGAPVAHERGLRLLRGLARRVSPARTSASPPRAARRSTGGRRLGDGPRRRARRRIGPTSTGTSIPDGTSR